MSTRSCEGQLFDGTIQLRRRKQAKNYAVTQSTLSREIAVPFNPVAAALAEYCVREHNGQASHPITGA